MDKYLTELKQEITREVIENVTKIMQHQNVSTGQQTEVLLKNQFDEKSKWHKMKSQERMRKLIT